MADREPEIDLDLWRRASEMERQAWTWEIYERLLGVLWRFVEMSEPYWDRGDPDDFLTPDLHYRYDLAREAVYEEPRDQARSASRPGWPPT